MKPPCLLFEDDHLLAINKPAGLNTHAPSPFAGEGLYDWLRHREPRWANLAIIHRLDKETSGVILFSKTTLANRSLTEQFTMRAVQKKYLLLTDRSVPKHELEVKSALVRVGEKYVSRPIAAGAEIAQTRFRVVGSAGQPSPGTLVQAEPLTGRTHQIRVHAADKGFPILGDSRYGGTYAARLCLHAEELSFRHPVSGEEMSFRAEADFLSDPRIALRRAIINPQSTNAFRLLHGASDARPGCYVDQLGPYLLAQAADEPNATQLTQLTEAAPVGRISGVYTKRLVTAPRDIEPAELSPKLISGPPAPERFQVLENGVTFELSFAEGYSVGLFLDQRDNRRRLLSRHVAADFPLFEPEQFAGTPEVLNTFAYTCGFSVCAAKSGARTTSLDLSKKYLDWGKANFVANRINPAEHDFIYGDTFNWLRRLDKKRRRFDAVLLDPPTFSRSKEFGAFRAEKDYGALVQAALPVLKTGGVLFASCNAAAWDPALFLQTVKGAISASHRQIVQEHYFPQPPDFPISRNEPAYLKTVWLRVR